MIRRQTLRSIANITTVDMDKAEPSIARMLPDRHPRSRASDTEAKLRGLSERGQSLLPARPRGTLNRSAFLSRSRGTCSFAEASASQDGATGESLKRHNGKAALAVKE